MRLGSSNVLSCPSCGENLTVRFKAVELTSWGTIRTLGMKGARKVRLPLKEWIHDEGRGFTTAKGINGARFVADLARQRKKNPPYRTAITLVLGHGLVSENRWVTVFQHILIFAVIERSDEPQTQNEIMEAAL